MSAPGTRESFCTGLSPPPTPHSPVGVPPQTRLCAPGPSSKAPPWAGLYKQARPERVEAGGVRGMDTMGLAAALRLHQCPLPAS